MDKLNEYLQQLISTCGHELHLEPNKSPYVVTSTGNTNITSSPLPGTQINMMIFSLIPAEVKQQLPNSSEVEFVHPHNLGDFNFLVRKSPAGFNVTISPVDKMSAPVQETESADSDFSTPLNSSAGIQTANPPSSVQSQADESDLVIELNSPPPAKGEFMSDSSISNEVLSTSQYELEMFEDPEVEVEASVSDPAGDSAFYQQYEAEKDTPVQNGFSQNQSYDAPQNFSETNGTPATSDNFENVNNYYSQNQESGTDVSASVVEDTNSAVPQNTDYTAPQTQAEQIKQPPQVAQTPPPTFQEPAKVSMPAVQANPQARAKMDALFRKMAEIGSSDLHLSVTMPPMVRKDGKMAKLDESHPVLTPDTMKELLQSIMPEKNIEEFARRSDTDFAYEIPDLARFRANIFMDRKGMGGVFRIIPSDIMTAEDLNLSKHILDLCNLSKGLVVVTGPTGSGKSTTLCAMIDYINRNREDHIITIEDPIEFTHDNKLCLVNQREVHNHTDSFKDALRAALREDPDILLVGEMRDLETISIAIETAETGHLVFGTLHTTTAASTVDRIIDQFPADRQQQIRVMLSESLRGVIAQTLLPKKGGGRIAALEVLIVTPAISNLIREGKTFQIPSAMQTGKNKGMVMLNDALMELVNKGIVEPKDAYIKSVDKEGFEMLLQRNGKRI